MARQIPVYQDEQLVNLIGTYSDEDPFLRTLLSRKQARLVRPGNGRTFLVLTKSAPMLPSQKPDKSLELRQLMGTRYSFMETLADHRCWSLKTLTAKGVDLAPIYRQAQIDCMVTA